jgi:hypothetical protein
MSNAAGLIIAEIEKIDRIAEIDKMFEEATGWGSWMIMAANEREDLANKIGVPHKYLARIDGKRTD